MRTVVEPIPTNRHCSIFHCRIRIEEQDSSYDPGFYSTKEPEGFVQMLLEVPGVESVLTRGYAVWVSKGHAFTWDEVGPRVLEILELMQDASEVTSIEKV